MHRSASSCTTPNCPLKHDRTLRVLDKEFKSFGDVVQWAWDTYKLDLNYHDVMDEDLQQQACEQLEEMIREGKL